MAESSPKGLFRSYPRVFWVANVMELFERAAYYGLNSVLAIYLTNSVQEGGLGFSEQSVGFLQSLIYAITYVVPILGGALADRYGYRRMLLVAFSLLSTGYFVSGHMSAYGAIFAALLIMATGAGLFKPIISGTIARTTTEKTSGFGFGIYYWMINLGAFHRTPHCDCAEGDLLESRVHSFVPLHRLDAPSNGVLYRDPPRPENTKRSVTCCVVRHRLGDARFMLMIFVYSGFWILYFQNFGSVLWFLRDFVNPEPMNRLFQSMGFAWTFGAEHVTAINAGTIILLQVVVSRVVKNMKALPTMVAGMTLGVCGFVLLAFASTVWMFIAAIAVFSIGEMTAHPKYYSYVGVVAPVGSKSRLYGLRISLRRDR